MKISMCVVKTSSPKIFFKKKLTLDYTRYQDFTNSKIVPVVK